MQRSFLLLKTPFKLPDKFPVNTIKNQRILTVVKLFHVDFLAQITREFFVFLLIKKAYFTNNINISENHQIEIILLKVLKSPLLVSEIIELSQTQFIKDELFNLTQSAVERVFWSSDNVCN